MNQKKIDSILYVEDDIYSRDLLISILCKFANNLYVASNGEEGFKVFKEHKPTVVITDIKMPIMNGLELTKEIKKINKYTKVILLTAFNDELYIEESKKLNVDYYLYKPIDLDELKEALEK